MDSKLLVNQAFHNDFFERLESAVEHIELQFMTFEGDEVGWRVARLLMEKARQGVAVRVIIDHCSDFRVQDTFALYPSTWPLIRETRLMIAAMEAAGVRVKRTNPPGILYAKFLHRNHKKIAIIDDVCYLGGVNVSSHNFAWHDFMVRMNHNSTHLALADFEATWRSEENRSRQNFFIEKDLGTEIRKLIESARSEIILSSAYFMDRLTINMLAEAAARGVRTTILTVRQNNLFFLRLITPYLFQKLRRSGVEVYFYDAFSHAKYLIVDRNKVLFGSSNFGYESYMTKDELCVLSDEPALVNAFINELYNRDIASATPAQEMRGIPRALASFITRGHVHVIRWYGRMK